MADVLHSALTGADLHETKGAASAASGQVPIANGSGGAPFGQLQWTQVGGKPSVPSYYLNDVQLTGPTLIKHYTTTASAGLFSVTLTGFSTIHSAFATAISGGTALGTAAIANVATLTTSSVTGSVLVFSGSQTNLGTTQAVRVTVIGA
jgi:hypothetical protein